MSAKNSRQITIIGNWKMNLNKELIKEFFLHLEEIQFQSNVTAGIASQAMHIPLVINYAGKFALLTGAQDCSAQVNGAYTGELSPAALKDIGADFTLVGHSERRTYHQESNQLLNSKVIQALSQKLKVIYCVGESLEQRENNQTFDILKTQLAEGLKNIKHNSPEDLIIAYEPVWAIGTGKTASSEQAEEVHQFIREQLATIIGLNAASDTVILYGGSVKPNNIKELISKENVDGALVGGASLDANSFSALCN